MTAQIQAELLKVRSTRTTAGLALGMVALILLFVMLTAFLSHAADLETADNQRNLFGIGSFAGVFSALAGILLVTGEYRFGTIRPTFLFTARRSTVMAAKVAAGMLAGLVLAVVGEALSVGIGDAILSGRGISVTLDRGDLGLLTLGTLLGTALWGGIGVGLGAIVRNQVAAVIGLLAWGFVVENLLFALAPSVGRLTPGQAQNGLMGMTTDHLLSAGPAAVVLIVWTAALVVGGAALTARRDVN